MFQQRMTIFNCLHYCPWSYPIHPTAYAPTKYIRNENQQRVMANSSKLDCFFNAKKHTVCFLLLLFPGDTIAAILDLQSWARVQVQVFLVWPGAWQKRQQAVRRTLFELNSKVEDRTWIVSATSPAWILTIEQWNMHVVSMPFKHRKFKEICKFQWLKNISELDFVATIFLEGSLSTSVIVVDTDTCVSFVAWVLDVPEAING